MKSEIEIADDMYDSIKKSGIMGLLTGSLEKNGKRQKDSTKEDAIISIEANDNEDDKQMVFVVVNVYIADIRIGGQYVRNDKRLREVCRVFLDTLKVGGIGKDYTYHLEKQRVVPEEGTNEHRIWNRFLYKQLID